MMMYHGSSIPEFIQISDLHYREMVLHVKKFPEEEVCGILGGRIGEKGYHVELVLPVTNELHSPVRYRMQPQAQLDALFTLEKKGMNMVAIYHSHLNGSALPSGTDIDEAFYPNAVYLIWFYRMESWQCRAYRIERGEVQEIMVLRSANDKT